MRATVRAMAVPFKVQGPATDPSFRPRREGKIATEELKKAVGQRKA